jgi:hypothetical protein
LAFRNVILFTKRLWSDLFAAKIAYLYFHMVLIHYYVLILKYFCDLNRRVFASTLRIYIWFLLIDLAVETFLKRIIIVYFFIFWIVYLFYTLIQFDFIILTIVMRMILHIKLIFLNMHWFINVFLLIQRSSSHFSIYLFKTVLQIWVALLFNF